ncbi:MAG: response regulator [Gemmatimonadota bacterium]
MKTLLLIDPGEANRHLVTALFSFSDVRVQAAVTIREGVDAALREMPDVIVTEFMIPERGGRCVIEALKRREALKAVPIIVWAAEGIADARTRTEQYGGRFVPKSSPPLVLVQAILGALEIRKPPRSAPAARSVVGDPTAA